MLARKGSAIGTSALVVAIIALGVAIGAILMHRESADAHEGEAERAAVFQRMSGLEGPGVTNTLDKRYTDADGDLVADAPTDASKQIDPPTLTFTYVAVEDDVSFRDGFKPLIAAISAATGKPVEFVSFTSPEDELRAVRDGKLHIASLNTGSVPLGVCTAGFVPVAQLAGDEVGHHLTIIAPADSSIGTGLSSLRGHELTLTDPTSNSGYKAPLILLREAGLRPPTDYLLRYSYGHPQSIEGIKAKKYQAAAVADDVLKREIAEGKIATSDFKTIYTSDKTFPGAAIGYCSLLKPELAAKIRKAINEFNFKGTEMEKLFGPEGKNKFVPVDYKKDWEFIRRNDDAIGFSYVLKDAPPTTQPMAQASPVSIERLRLLNDSLQTTIASIKALPLTSAEVPDKTAKLIPTKWDEVAMRAPTDTDHAITLIEK
ncbi:MAG: phosphate/phosphite/phosphonate ABC transporter substrate-binding protein [Tepidisphaeraceae bacterium]